MAGHIYIYGGIGTDVRQHEISAEDVRNQIDQNKSESELIVHIVSPGGDVFEGEAIYNALKNSGKKVITNIEGTCASIATLIAAAGDPIIMNKSARFMIHNPKITGMQSAADSRDLRHVADQLDQIKTLLINVYLNKTGLGKEKLWELYDNETWLTADEAVKMGFIDEAVDAIKAVATVNLKKLKMKQNVGIWARVQNMIQAFNSFKNAFTEALADGRVVVVESEDENWTGKSVYLEDGSPLPAGDYPLASGKTISVDDQSTITAVTEAPPPANQQQTEEMDNKIKELEAQLAEAKNAKELADATAKAAQAQAAGAEAKATKFENRVKAIETDFLKLKEEASKTMGDLNDLPKGPVIKNANQQVERDAMGEEALQFFKNRNLVK
jgi:ATP-dependent protease ClpP protease subunit